MPTPKKASEGLNLASDHVKEIAALATNEFAQKFATGDGEIVIRWKNFTRNKRYFVFNVTEVDADGNLLKAAPAAADNNGSLKD